MAGLTSIIMILFFLMFYVNIVSSTNNTTQLGNFTVEWIDFNLLSCAVPTTINISLFTCIPSAVYTQVNDTSCLSETIIDFDQNTCQAPTTASMYTNTASTTQRITTVTMKPIQTSNSTAAAAAQSITAANKSYASINTETSFKSTTITAVITNTSTANSVTAHVSTSAQLIGYGSINTTTTTTTHVNAATTTTSVNTAATTTSVNTAAATTTRVNTAAATTTSANTAAATTTSVNTATTTTTSANTAAATTTSANTAAATTTSVNTATTTTTSVNTATTTAANTYSCPNDDYIGAYCNISSDACAMSQPCLNAAICFPNDILPYQYSCQCQKGYTGDNCENDERVCMENTCWNDGTCVPINSNNGSNFTCECVEGYNGIYCEFKIDLCGNITCENKGICLTVELKWKCLCLDSTFYYGDYCQLKTTKLKIREILSKSFASVAIGAIITTCGFIIVMDVLKYAFHIDPVEHERESYRQRLEAQRRSRRTVKNGPKFALRFQYVS